MLEQVKLKDAKFNVPNVTASVVDAPALPSVIVIPDALTINGPSDAPLNVYVPLANALIVVVV